MMNAYLSCIVKDVKEGRRETYECNDDNLCFLYRCVFVLKTVMYAN